MLNRKSDDRRFEINGRYVHIYENLVEVTIDDDIQYEGELHVLETDLNESVINANLDNMICMLLKIREQGRSCSHKGYSQDISGSNRLSRTQVHREKHQVFRALS